jgi:hypothetical protein
MRILDMSAGHRKVWFNRLNPDTVFVDHRLSMNPTVCCDTRHLPFKEGTFDLIVFDPPHMMHGKGTDMAKFYGAYEAEDIRSTVTDSVKEAFRCSTGNALMALKWSTHDVRLNTLLSWIEGWQPMFGHAVSTLNHRKTSTYWVMFQKSPSGFSPESVAQRVLTYVDQ